MRLRQPVVIFLFLALLAPAALVARQSILLNGSLEFGPGPVSEDPHIPANWITFGPTVERSDEANFVPLGAGHSLKAFSSDPQVGAYQDVPAVPGDSVSISASLYTRGTDKLSGDAQAWIALEFYKADNQQVGFHPLAVLNASSPADTWVYGSVGPFVAPALTAYARMTCVWTWAGSATGSAYWDDCLLTVNNGPNQLVNGDFETAGLGAQSPFGIDDWTGFNDQEKSSDVAKDGTASVKLGIADAYSGLFQNMAVLNAGDHVYLKAWVWNPASDPLTQNSAAGLKLEFDANGVVPPPEENLAFDQNAPKNTWVEVLLDTTVPPAITVARVVCIFGGNPQTTGAVHFDDAWAERGSQPGVNTLLNASFETGPGGANGLTNWTEFGSGDATTRKSCFSVPAHSGVCTAKATGGAFTGVYQEIAVTPGETLSMHAYLYTPSSAPLTGTGIAGVKVEWRYGNVPEDIDIGGATNTIDASDPTNTWIPLHIDYTMPAGSNAITRFVNLIAANSAPTGRVYFDACEAVVLNKFNGADADGDNDEDVLDFAQFQRAYSGSGGPMRWNGIVFDSDGDNDVDMTDFNYFTPRMTGLP
jgi:hypothetical protein